MSAEDMSKLLEEARRKLRAQQRYEKLEDDFIDLASARLADKEAFDRQRRDLEERAQLLASTLQTVNEALRRRPEQVTPSAPPQVREPLSAAASHDLQHLINSFLATFNGGKKQAMLKKHQAALGLLGALLGDRPINQLRQTNINEYFRVVEKLPPRWAQVAKRQGVSARELADANNGGTLNKKTFDDNYLVPVRIFLEYCSQFWQDEGFPATLSTAGIEFGGPDNAGSHRQRPFDSAELERLFHGPELVAARSSSHEEHKWWLAALAFYTGARVNELCQINPKTDISNKNGIDYILITPLTDTDERVVKSVKGKKKRVVPLHPELLELGFLVYVKRIREANHKLLFPAWNPTKGRASIQAQRWFRDLLREIGLRDESVEAGLRGFHAFRHTLLARAANSHPPVDAGPITGHASVTKSAIQRGYEGELELPAKLAILKSIHFGFRP